MASFGLSVSGRKMMTPFFSILIDEHAETVGVVVLCYYKVYIVALLMKSWITLSGLYIVSHPVVRLRMLMRHLQNRV